MRTNVGRAVRALRRSRGWRQIDLAPRAGVSREAVSRIERGEMLGMTVGTVDRIVRAVGGEASLMAHWRGEQLDRLVDAVHAAVQQSAADQLARAGWVVRVEVSFNHYGDRGRIDVMAWHPRVRALLVVEVKSAIGDLQDMLGRLDIKARVARTVGRSLGWTDVTGVVPAIVVRDGEAARRVIRRHPALFTRFDARGRAALAWVRQPSRPLPAGALWFVSDPPHSRHATTARVRVPGQGSRRTPHVNPGASTGRRPR
ncbi:MAG: helix-turn-helix transcriptional regulator [Chloroflexota bacterium]